MTDDAGERPEAVEKNKTSLEESVAKLRVLEEENARIVKLIAEGHGARLDSLSATLDSHSTTLNSHSAKLDSHSAKLDSLSGKINTVITALEPLNQIKDFIERVADEHELRLTALEKHTNLRE